MRHGLRRMGLRGWPESSLSGGADSAEMWEGDEGMSIWAEASGRVAEGVRTDWMRSAQSSKSAGNDWSNMQSGIDSAWVGSGLRPCARQLGRGYLGFGSTEVDDGGPESGIRSEHPMVSVAMEAWRWDEANESSEKAAKTGGSSCRRVSYRRWSDRLTWSRSYTRPI